MKKTKLLRTILIPTLGITTIAPVVITTSCGEVIRVTDVDLNKKSTMIAIGKSETLTATISPEDATDKSVTWSSSDESIATVDENGKITALKEGKTTITVTTKDAGFTATCEVTVNKKVIHVTDVDLNKSKTKLYIGGTETLTATVLPQEATDKSVSWSSNNESVASVAQDGTITAKSVGKATITVTTKDVGKTDTCEVDVEEYIHVTNVTLDKTELLIYKFDHSKTLKATVLPENATDKSVTWSSSDESIATVDSDGTVRPVALGETDITVTTKDGGKTGKCHVIVKYNIIHVTDVKLNKKSTSLHIGDTETLTATIEPGYADDRLVSWSSDDESVASVDQNGKITALKEGNTTITVTTHDGGKTDTCEVNVQTSVVHVERVELNKNQTTLGVGDTETLTATVLPGNATDKRVTWSSNYSDVATVDENGKITALKEGKTTITVTTKDGGKTDTCEVNVIPTRVDNYVCLTANAYSTLKLVNTGGNKPDLQYSLDGEQWDSYSDEINIAKNQTLFLKGNNPTGWSHSANEYSHLKIEGDVLLSGNVMALLDNGAKEGEEGDIANIPNDHCFKELFINSSGITNVDKDFLPARNLTLCCYDQMFEGCTSLNNPPELPAKTLAGWCYYHMFRGCTSLIDAPALPATTLADNCYCSMFYGCTSLANAPELPVTTLADYCYLEMFFGCTNLIQAPSLPATTLAFGCYENMFEGCTSLTHAPDLMATTLAEACYANMFENCKSLNSIKIGYTKTVANAPQYAFSSWVNGIAASGTFYYKGIDTLKNFGFPSGWTIDRNW